MRIEGSCTCGNIHLIGEVDPLKTQIGHCTDCQTGSGSAFRVSVSAPGDTLKITGKLSTYLKTSAESGTPRVQAFCTVCGVISIQLLKVMGPSHPTLYELAFSNSVIN